MGNVAIIPARGGSKRIPRKNIKPFLGKPIISYSIAAALNSGLFDEVMVSTNDEEIAEVARKYGACVPFLRSTENSDDFAGTVDVLIEVLEEYSKRNRSFNFCCCIYPTASLIKIDKINEAFNLLQHKKLDVVFPVCPFSYPILRSLKLNNDGKIAMNWPDNINKRSQDLPKSYHDAGQFYWFNTHKLMENKMLLGFNTGAIQLDEMEVQDIDNETDWKLAEMKYRLMYES